MTRAKPVYSFRVRIVQWIRGIKVTGAAQRIQGETFYLARAAFCAETPDVHPDEVRPIPTGDGCRVS